MIRMATTADIPAILRIYGPYIINTTCTFEYTVPTEEEFKLRFETITEKLPWLVWEENGQVLGYAYGSLPFHRAAYQWCCEVSIYLAPEIQGRGVGRRLYAALEHILFAQGYRVIYSLITSENETSLHFHERMGYQRIAVLPDCGVKFGRWLGVVWMEKRSNAVEIPSSIPVKWRLVVENGKNIHNILATLSLS